MNELLWKKQKLRSPLRIKMGTIFYCLLRRWQWCVDKRPQARLDKAVIFPHIVFSHESPLDRKLANQPEFLVANKAINLSLAVKELDGLVLRPGECMSYWRLVGKPVARRGFVPGLVLHQGKSAIGIGGGLCQLSNLLYWMSLHTGLTISERWRHSYDVFPDSERTLPFGSGATCVYNYRDLCIENHSAESYQLQVSLGDGFLRGQWRSDFSLQNHYKVYEKSHWFSQSFNGKYIRNNILHRQVWQGSQLKADEYLTENHALMMYQPFLDSPAQADV